MNDQAVHEENPEILRVQELTRRMERVNEEIEHMLSRLPLTHHREVARLNQLLNEQTRLVSSTPQRRVPPRITVFYDNARDKASFLRQRYNEALSNGLLRRSVDGD